MIFDKIGESLNGSISVIQGNKILFQKAYGFRDMPNEIDNKLDTKFQTASACKVFVATAILQLIEKGQLNFDDRIDTILSIPLNQINSNITVRQLLNHTSGIPDYFDESIMDNYADLWIDYPNYRIRKSEDLVPLFIHKSMMYEPGERFQYNNTGYVVLGLMIEAITGEAFDCYLQKAIFEPAGMKNTGFYELDRLPKNCANAYIYDESTNAYYTNIYSVDAKGTGAGGAFTTVLDIDLFWVALQNGTLLSSEMLKKMLTIQSSDGNNDYGYGIWFNRTKEDFVIPYFQGCDPGVSFISSYDESLNLQITIVSNYGDNVWRMEREIREAYRVE